MIQPAGGSIAQPIQTSKTLAEICRAALQMQSHTAFRGKVASFTICWCQEKWGEKQGSHDKDVDQGWGRKASVVQDTEVARYNFVFQHGAGWYIDPISVVSDDDDGALE